MTGSGFSCSPSAVCAPDDDFLFSACQTWLLGMGLCLCLVGVRVAGMVDRAEHPRWGGFLGTSSGSLQQTCLTSCSIDGWRTSSSSFNWRIILYKIIDSFLHSRAGEEGKGRAFPTLIHPSLLRAGNPY